ncbi:MAG: HAMP domain-containing protein, partial [Anaerolineae bacterium]|nr:HAMP domain-containing protein [Anaerolineae bacterium]
MPIWELGWGVVVQRPLADIYAEVGQLRTTMLVAIVISILLAGVVGWVVSKRIADPIRKLARASERVAQGDLLTPVAVKSSNEIGVLARSFNQMVSSLKRSRSELEHWAQELEKRVQERTAELAVAKEHAEAADRLKSAFLATMSHELRTPLNSIIGFTGIVLQGLAGPLNDEQTKQLGMVRDSARHLLTLINDVLDISKIEAGQVEIVSEPFDMPEAIEKVVRAVTPLAERKGLALAAKVAPEVGQITSDRRRVEQILINLINNAIKFTDEGQVTITADLISDQAISDFGIRISEELAIRNGTLRIPQSAIRIQVSDTGIGIKPEDMGKLFEAFRQIETGLTRQYEGT